MDIAFGVTLLILAVALVVLVLFQSGKDKNLSGAIAGAGETFFSKGRANTMDRILNKITIVLCAVFFVLVLAMYCIVA